MIALGIRYLTGYAAARDMARQRPEWPPHPGRVFMALAAAHFETGADPDERAALEWLETLPPPAMKVSEAFERSEVRAYVPVNDVHGAVVSRPRQDRVFSKIRPQQDSVFLIWNSQPEHSVRNALDHVCRKVTRIGHSASAVQMWVTAEWQEPEPNLVPGDGAERLRVAAAGTLQSLVEAFNGEAIAEYEQLAQALELSKGKEKARIKQELEVKFSGERPSYHRPLLTHWQAYKRPDSKQEQPVLDGPFDPNFIVLTKEEGPALGLEPTLRLTRALRNAAMKAAGADPPEWLTGHDPSGSPSAWTHVAFFPLPYVGSEYADAHVLGLGIAIPKDLRLPAFNTRDAELKRVLGPLFFDMSSGEERSIRLWSTPKSWEWELRREVRERPPVTLQRDTWTRPSRIWASVTPVVLHHYPKKNRDGDVERILMEAFRSAGFPEPAALETRSVSLVQGAGHAMSLPPFEEGGPELCRYQTHVRVSFPQPVRGPLLVGRGRFRGYGLFRPVPAEVQA